MHTWFGQFLLAVIFSHMISWWVVYDEQASFPEDILQVPMWFPTNAGCAHDDKKCWKDAQTSKFGGENNVKGPTSDNYTIRKNQFRFLSCSILHFEFHIEAFLSHFQLYITIDQIN